jgi:hypothetical protein
MKSKKVKQEEAPQSLIIANPIYDTVFKYMMENERVAKFFIGTLLGQNVLSVDFKNPTKSKMKINANDAPSVQITQLDFVATVKTEDGEHKKILIEIQKSNHRTDVIRFREYLVEQYKKKETVNDKEEVLPITTIYVLGFKLPEIPTACLQVERNYKDLVNGGIIEAKSAFVEKLTHDSYIVQVRRIEKRYKTRLDKLLSIFEQDNFIDGSENFKEFHHIVDKKDEEFSEVCTTLAYCASNAAMRRRIEEERKSDILFEDAFGESYRKIEERDKIIEEKKRIIEEKDKALEEKDKVLEEKDNIIAEQARLIAEFMESKK